MRAACYAAIGAVIFFLAGPPVAFGADPEPGEEIRTESVDAGERVREPAAPAGEEVRDGGTAPRSSGGIDEIEKRLEESVERQGRNGEETRLQFMGDEWLLSALR